MVTEAPSTLQGSGRGRGRTGETWVFMTAGSLLVLITLLVGVIFLLTLNGLSVFWPHLIARVTTNDGTVIVGQAWREEAISQDEAVTTKARTRTLFRTGNRREFVRDLLRAELVKDEWADQEGETVGVLVLVYDHDTARARRQADRHPAPARGADHRGASRAPRCPHLPRGHSAPGPRAGDPPGRQPAPGHRRRPARPAGACHRQAVVVRTAGRFVDGAGARVGS